MGEHVCLKGTRLCKGQFTLCATKWFFPCMCSLVSLEMTCTGARVIALYAVERPFSWMGSLVFLQSASIGAREFAQCATKRSFPWMSPHVSLENRGYFARVVALLANENLVAISLRLNDITWCVDCLRFCDRSNTKDEEQLIAKVDKIFGECQWKVKVITLLDSDVRFLPFYIYHAPFFAAQSYRPTLAKRLFQNSKDWVVWFP